MQRCAGCAKYMQICAGCAKYVQRCAGCASKLKDVQDTSNLNRVKATAVSPAHTQRDLNNTIYLAQGFETLSGQDCRAQP